MSEPVSPSGSVGVKVGEDAEEEKLQQEREADECVKAIASGGRTSDQNIGLSEAPPTPLEATPKNIFDDISSKRISTS